MMSAALSGTRIGLAPRFSHVVSAENEVVLVSDDESVTLTGRAVADLMRLLDGTRSAFEIAEQLHLAHRADLVYRSLDRLESRGLLATDTKGDAVEEEAEAGGWSPAAHLTNQIRGAWNRRVGDSPVSVAIPDRGGGVVTLLLTDDYLRPSLVAAAARAFSAGEPVVLGRLGWERVWLGPFVDPMRTACLSCLLERLRLNLPARALVHAMSSSHDSEAQLNVLRLEAHPSAPRLLAALISDAANRSGRLSGLGNLLLVRHRSGGPDEVHAVQWLPDCPQCGSPNLEIGGHNFRLVPRCKVGGSGGGYRTTEPQATLRRLEHLIDPLTGPVRFIERVTAGDASCVHTYTANHAGGVPRATLKSVRAYHRDHSGGKGATDLDARTSALCESLERYSALFRGREPERFASLEELGGAAVAPNEILHVSDRQYETRVEWNGRFGDHFQHVPEPYPQDAPISWTTTRSLVTDEVRYVPTASVYLGFQGAGAQYIRADSNGLAGGNCIEEAILQAFLELVERDAVAIWWYNRLAVRAVDIHDSSDSYVDAVHHCYERSGRDLWLLDLTTDLGIPCLAAISSRRDGPREDIIFGFGAHLDASIALRRALTELNQMLPTVLRGQEERKAQLLPEFLDVIEWWETATLAAHPYLLPDPASPPHAITDFPRYEADDLLADVEHCVKLAAAHDMDVLVRDLTRPDIGLSVARVIVPPLRHFWRRLGPGRLYDVPVQMGSLERPTTELEMNPVSMFV